MTNIQTLQQQKENIQMLIKNTTNKQRAAELCVTLYQYERAIDQELYELKQKAAL